MRTGSCRGYWAEQSVRPQVTAGRVVIHGIMSVVSRWIENDCDDSIDYVVSVIRRCVSRIPS